MRSPADEEDALNCAKGVIYAVGLGIIFWCSVALLIYVITVQP
jgi:disulfide bond formation protein DsbB